LANKLKHEREVTPVSDPIHKRFEFSIFERELIDSDYFQRLHFVLQNGVTYVAFPANKNTRFPHSLGVCHIAGRIYSRGLQNTDTQTLSRFVEDAADFLTDLIKRFEPASLPLDRSSGLDPAIFIAGYRDTIAAFSDFKSRPLLKENYEIPFDSGLRIKGLPASFVIETIWQALRIYALMHDIGHLPMSHAFERAISTQAAMMGRYAGVDQETIRTFKTLYDRRLSEFSGLPGRWEKNAYYRFFGDLLGVESNEISESVSRKAFHEIRGLAIFNKFVAIHTGSLTGTTRTNVENYRTLVLYCCLAIIFSDCAGSEGQGRPFLRAVRRLVDGEIDSDRLDYTMRDGHASGSDIGRFDLERICANSYLLRSEKCAYTFGFYERAISGVEQFFEHRYQSYKYIIQHRTSARSNKLLEVLIGRILMHAFLYPQFECAELLVAYGYLKRKGSDSSTEFDELLPEGEEDVIRVDDANLRTLLFRIRVKLNEAHGTKVPHNASEREVGRRFLELEILNLLEIILLRRFEHVISPLDRSGFSAYLRKYLGEENIAQLPDERQVASFIVDLLGEGYSRADDVQKDLSSFCSAALTEDRSVPVTVIIDVLRPKVYEPASGDEEDIEKGVWIMAENGKYTRVERRSRILRDMSKRVVTDWDVRLYIVAREIDTEKVWPQVEGKLKDFLVSKWKEYVASVAST
jgi:HD superfamily phosphohydrolase